MKKVAQRHSAEILFHSKSMVRNFTPSSPSFTTPESHCLILKYDICKYDNRITWRCKSISNVSGLESLRGNQATCSVLHFSNGYILKRSYIVSVTFQISRHINLKLILIGIGTCQVRQCSFRWTGSWNRLESLCSIGMGSNLGTRYFGADSVEVCTSQLHFASAGTQFNELRSKML